jgi:IS4 transposase
MSSIPIHDEKLNAEFLQQLYREKVQFEYFFKTLY